MFKWGSQNVSQNGKLEKAFLNKYNSFCAKCKTPLAEGQGFAYKYFNEGYKAVCSSSICVDMVEGLREFLEPKREITPEGNILINPVDWDAIPVIRTIPGAKFNPDTKIWSVSIEPEDRKIVVESCKKLNLKMPEGFDQVSVSPDYQDTIDNAQSVGAYPYQLEGIEFLAGKKKALLGDDMGLGKTMQSILALPKDARAIFLCPATLKANVAKEVRQWRPDLVSVTCNGKNSFFPPNKGEVVILNYDILPQVFDPLDKYGNSSNCPEAWKPLLKETILIADEAHVCKNPKAKKSQRTKVLSKLCGKVWAMTGTPILSKGMDLWGILSSFDMEREVFTSWNHFTSSMNASKGMYGWKFGTPTNEVPLLLKKVMKRRLKSDVLTDLPPKQYQDMLVEVKDQSLFQMLEIAYEKIKDVRVQDSLPDFQEFSEARAKLAKDKIPALLNLVESFEEADEPLVVFSAHKAPVEALSVRDGWGVITSDTSLVERNNLVHKFQDGFLKGIALTIKAGGVGLTLTNASKMIFVDLEWNPALNLQAEDRICRIGQTASNLQYIRLVSNCSLDVHLYNILDSKAKMIHAAIDAEGSIEYTPNSNQNGLSSQIKEESVLDREARMKAREKAIKRASDKLMKAQASLKVKSIKNSLGDSKLLPTPDSQQAQDIFDALNLMLERCDGASLKDNVGFNKPDSHNMRHIRISGLLENDVDLQKYVWSTLRKYGRQLVLYYPSLFKS